jgi:hypothetical protein
MKQRKKEVKCVTSSYKLNNPEYRWYHKEELSKIMPYRSKRKQLGIKILNYDKLRIDNDNNIHPTKDRSFNWLRLHNIVDIVPDKPDMTRTKKHFDARDRLHFEARDKGKCVICGQINHYGSNNKYSLYEYNNYNVSHLHHILPNGDVTDSNIVTLCTHCHQVVHQILYLCGKWRYARPL